jgi:TPR repeat protein
VPEDAKKAAEWFETAAVQGHVEAQNILAVMYI